MMDDAVLRRRALFCTVGVAVLFVAACSDRPEWIVVPQEQPAATRTLLLLTGPSTGAYAPLGRALADAYNRRLPRLHVTAQSPEGPRGAGENAQAVEDGKADLGFSRADLAFQAFRRSGGGASHLRSIAVLYTNAVHVLVRRGSGIKRGEDMRGRRVQVTEDAAGGPLARFVLEAYGLTLDDVQSVDNPRNAVARLKSGELDVRVFASAYPLPGIDDVSESSAIKLLSLAPDVVERLRSRFSFFKPTVIPRGTYRGQTADVQTVGIDGLLLCRDTMPEDLVYELTRGLFEAIHDESPAQNFTRLINTSNAPATPVPLHPGAARYYRERDLFR